MVIKAGENISMDQGLDYLKDKIFSLISFFWITLGAPLFILGTYMFYIHGNVGYAMVEMLLYFVTALVITSKNLTVRFKKIFTVSIIYLVSISILIIAGAHGIGMVSIFFSLVLAGCLLDSKQFYQVVIVNIMIFIAISVLLDMGYFNGTFMGLYRRVWLINGMTAQACGYVLVFIIDKIFKGLEAQNKVVKKSKELLLESEYRYEAMLSNISDFIAIVDAGGIIKYISPNLERRSTWRVDEILNKSLWEKIHLDDRDKVKVLLEKLLEKDGAESREEVRVIYKDGQEVYIELIATNLINDKNINGILVKIQNITLNKKREEKILYLNHHDVLTGLYNRRFFDKEKEMLDAESQLPLSVIIGDINGLKMINDSLGHMEGDKLLKAVAKILESCCSKDDVVARIGGDEFSILLPKKSSEEVSNIAKKINIACEAYNKNVTSKVNYVSISLGYATKTKVSESFDYIQKVAGENMYKRKLLDGRSFRSTIIASMKMALHEKSQETNEHSERIVKLSREVGKVIGLKDQQFDELELVASLHDIGKIGIDDTILNKPDKLTEEEWEEMKKHCEIGYRIAMSSPELIPIAEYILTHHERFDGSGYPQGLSGEDIPLLSRIVSVVDSYDAMTEDRPYRKGISKEAAIDEIVKNAGKQFDPDIAKVFIEIISNPNLQL